MGIQTSSCDIVGVLKKLKDTDPADSHYAPEWKRAPEEQIRGTQEQIVAVEVISMIDEGRLGEHLHAALPVRRERLPAGALQRGLAYDQESVVFAPWSVLLDRGEPCDSCQDAPHEAASACFPSRGVRGMACHMA